MLCSALLCFRRQLVTLFNQYDPAQVPTIDELLREWSNQEGQLLAKIQAQFKQPPTEPEPEPQIDLVRTTPSVVARSLGIHTRVWCRYTI